MMVFWVCVCMCVRACIENVRQKMCFAHVCVDVSVRNASFRSQEGNLEVAERIFVEASNNYFLSVRKSGGGEGEVQ